MSTQNPLSETPGPDTPLWQNPRPEDSLLYAFLKKAESRAGQSFDDFESLSDWANANLEEFWSLVWNTCGIVGNKAMPVMTSIDVPPYTRFFPHASLNYTENILNGAPSDKSRPAIIYRLQDGPDRIISWQELSALISLWEQGLRRAGIEAGDRIAVYMPNLPESVIIFLAAANIGAVFASAGSEMGADDLVNRFAQVEPKLLIAAEHYTFGDKEISREDVIARAESEIPSLKKVIRLHAQGADFLDSLDPQPLTHENKPFNQPLYILFSSGSTGKPKCFEHSAGGVLLKHMVEYKLHCDVHPGDRVFYHSTPSWMMWNWLVSGLAAGATILMYDGSPAYPDLYAQWAFTAENNCTHHGTAAPVILNWKAKEIKPADKFDLRPLRSVLSTAAVLPAQGYEYIHENIKDDVQVSPISGGTDLVGCFVGGNPLTPTYAGEIPGAILGCDVQVWDDNGKPCPPEEAGELVCTTPFPSMPLRFLNDPDGERYRDEYFSHYEGQKVWRHGDSIELTKHGQFRIIGRSDATLNQNGVRIGAVAIYEQLEPLKDRIREAAAVDFTRPDNEQAITILFLNLANGADSVPEDLQKTIRQRVKDNVTPYAMPTEIIAAPGVLKTPNGKTAEVVMKKILAGKSIPNPSLYGEELVAFYEDQAKQLKTKYS